MYDPSDQELNFMANGIVNAVKRYGIPYQHLSGQEIWEELKRKGYRFPVSGRRIDFLYESARWFDALDLAIKKLKSEIQQ
jgi:thermostable 8-oxoguanine DNA glycosylase